MSISSHQGKPMSLAKHFIGSYGTIYYVKDMKKACAVYSKKFGMKATYESDFWTEFDIKGTKMCLHLADAKMKKLPGGVMILNVVGMTKLVASLKKKGMKFIGKPHAVHGDDFTVDFYDLDKNIVSLYGKLK